MTARCVCCRRRLDAPAMRGSAAVGAATLCGGCARYHPRDCEHAGREE